MEKVVIKAIKIPPEPIPPHCWHYLKRSNGAFYRYTRYINGIKQPRPIYGPLLILCQECHRRVLENESFYWYLEDSKEHRSQYFCEKCFKKTYH